MTDTQDQMAEYYKNLALENLRLRMELDQEKSKQASLRATYEMGKELAVAHNEDNQRRLREYPVLREDRDRWKRHHAELKRENRMLMGDAAAWAMMAMFLKDWLAKYVSGDSLTMVDVEKIKKDLERYASLRAVKYEERRTLP